MRTRAEAGTLRCRTVFNTPTDADRLELDLRAVGDIAEALFVFVAAGHVDQAAEAVLRVSRAQDFHRVIPAILAGIGPRRNNSSIEIPSQAPESLASHISRRCRSKTGWDSPRIRGRPYELGTADSVSECSAYVQQT